MPIVNPVGPVSSVGPISPRVPMPAHSAPYSSPPPGLGRQVSTSPRAFAPPNPRGGPQAATVKLGSIPPSSRGGGGALSTEMKLAIAAGSLIAVLLVVGVLLLGKLVFRVAASPSVQTTTQTSTMPTAAAPAAHTRDPVVVPLDAATSSP
jgi:hypothetical protein